MTSKPILAVISDDIRRDLHAPLKYFRKISIIHFYREAGYQDMTKADFGKDTIQYKNFIDLYAKLKKLNPDIVQGPEPYASRAALANCFVVYIYCWLFKKPYVFPMFENRPAIEKFGNIKGKLMRFILKKYTNSSARAIYLNRGAKKELKLVGISDKKMKGMMWGTWGIDEQEFKPGSKYPDPTILYVGKVAEQKGIPEIIKAFINLKSKIPNLKWLVAGSGPMVENIKKISDVEYLGVVKNKDIPEYFQKSWLTVTPSVTTKIWEEQVGMVNIQSMACNTPVVSTTSGAIPEYVPDKMAGLLVPEHDPSALKKAIYKILTDKELRNKMGCQAREYTLKHYRAEDNIKKVEKLILDLVNHD